MTVVCHLLLMLAPALLVEEQRPGRAVCRLEIDSSEISLSGELRVTVSIEGPAPIEADVPRMPTLSHDWSVRTLPPKTSLLPGGRERWEQTFVFVPYQVGPVSLKLEPIRYRTGHEVLEWPLTWKPLEIRVVSVVRDLDRDAPRSVTDIETLPDLPMGAPWRYFGPCAAVAVAAALVFGWRWRTKAIPRQTTCLGWQISCALFWNAGWNYAPRGKLPRNFWRRFGRPAA